MMKAKQRMAQQAAELESDGDGILTCAAGAFYRRYLALF